MRVPVFLLLLVLSACSLFGSSGPRYVVFFQEGSAQLDAPAGSVIAQAARARERRSRRAGRGQRIHRYGRQSTS